MKELSKAYESKDVEAKWYQAWMDANAFHSDASKGGEPYCVVIPPPNVTGILHVGHVLNNTIQDILVRWRRMQGRNVVWMPGTDHAGIATQNKVEQALKEEGKTRDDLGRDAFIERVWTWREEYGGTIINQLKRLGASCDWERECFTMDPGLSAAVTDVFVQLYEKDLIYRGNRIINWCPRCQTALSDEESKGEDRKGHLWHIKYPVSGGVEGEFITVATTRPETMLGDVAVAMNPADERYADLPGKTITLPLVGRELVVIQDDYVDKEFGTGLVKVTPAHDPNDFEMGQRHNLESIDVMNEDGTMGERAGEYAGMDRFACRKKVVADLEELGLLAEIEGHSHAVGQCYRCKTIVEPRLSLQWFVRMEPLAQPAIDCVKDGRLNIVPDRWSNTYLEWMENIRDWCISRQIWWGHRIPVYYCDACDHQWAARETASVCASCSSADIRQDEDVLDTWFSSWLWPFSTFGWPEETDDLNFYYPGGTLVTGFDIIFFWVARMVMAGLEFRGEVPFKDVYIHGIVRDDKGTKISKQLGNFVDPIEYMDEYSADALRFSLMMILALGHDLKLPKDQIEVGRNFGTKLWNAARFMQMQDNSFVVDIENPVFDPALLSSEDKSIIYEMNQSIQACTEHLERYRFNDYAREVYDLVWHRLCDWYVEYSKSVFYGDDDSRKKQVLTVMHVVFANSLKLLHPVMPFITEELWQSMGYGAEGDFIMLERWPESQEMTALAAFGITEDVLAYVQDKHAVIRAGRMLKADLNIQAAKKMAYIIKPENEAHVSLLSEDEPSLMMLMRAESIIVDPAFSPEAAMPSAVLRLGTVYMPVDGVIDVAEELGRLTKQLDKLSGELKKFDGKLSNPQFVEKAPEEVIAQQRERRDEIASEAEKVSELIKALS